MSVAGISLVSVADSPDPPPKAICYGKQNDSTGIDGDGDERLWSIMADSPHGKIPGYATKGEAYYSHDGQDYTTKEFSWVVTDRHTYLVHNKYCSHAPANALVIAYPLGTPYYFSISRTNNGLIPGFSKGGDAVYAYGGKEHTTNDFDWIVVDHTGWFVIESKLTGGVLKIDFPHDNESKLKTSKCVGSQHQLWTWKGNSLVSKSGLYLGLVGGDAGASAVAMDSRGADMIETKWKIEGGKLISSLTGMALDIKDGSIWTNKDIILWPKTQSERVDSQSWRLVLYHP